MISNNTANLQTLLSPGHVSSDCDTKCGVLTCLDLTCFKNENMTLQVSGTFLKNQELFWWFFLEASL